PYKNLIAIGRAGTGEGVSEALGDASCEAIGARACQRSEIFWVAPGEQTFRSTLRAQLFLEVRVAADALFQPFQYKGLTLPNRVVMAPMTRSASPGGVPTEDVASYYARRVAGEVGFIISEGTGVDRPA